MVIARKNNAFARLSLQDRTFHVVCAIYLVVTFALVMYPLWYCVICSVSSSQSVIEGRVTFLPVEFSFKSYSAVLMYQQLRTGFFNSLIYVAGGTSVAVALVLLAAYPLSRRDMPGRKIFQLFFVITMFFGGGLIPNYILMRDLHLIGSRLSLILAFMFSCYNVIIVKTYFQNSVPAGLLDAAHIDGCGDVQFFFRIAIPLATPVIAVMVLFNAVGIWNSYFNGMLFLTKPETFNFQMVLRDILFVTQIPQEMMSFLDPTRLQIMRETAEQIRYAVLVIGALPMMILYPFIQKYFIRGMMIGSLKE